MNEEQTHQLLRHVKIMKNGIVVIAVMALIAFAYNGFRVYEYYLGSESQFRVNRSFYSDIQESGRTGNDIKIVTLCVKKLDQEPNNTGALTCLGEAYFRLGRWQDCIDTMNRLLGIAPTMEERVLPVIKKAQEKLIEAPTPEHQPAPYPEPRTVQEQ